MKRIKKIAGYISITVLVLALIFFSLGFIFPVVTYESRVVVNKPVDTSFQVFTSAFKLSDWVIGLKGIGWLKGMQNEVGSKWLFIITRNGKDYKLIQTLKEYKKNEIFVTDADNDLFLDQITVKFIPQGNTTEIVATSHFAGKNVLWRSVFACLQFSLGQQDQAMYEKLKEVIEKE